ncbi:MAG TPA: ATP-binding protein [Polyangiaceae bacterium]|nr:ATP-binding protein [Polyangiaceae bacterium]
MTLGGPLSERGRADGGALASESPTAPAVVWVVDDSRLQADVCREALASNYDVRVFEGGAAVLEALALGQAPQLLVLDWHMPDMSGVDVCRFVRETFDAARLPILILTATGDNESLLEGLSAGANDFVRKPFSSPELNARAAALVRSAALHRKLLIVEQQLRVEADFRERFMGMLAHDLRQPLNAIFMANSALSGSLASSPMAAPVQIQMRAAERMKRMIAELLDFTRVRPESGMPIQRSATDFAATMQAILAEVQAAHAERAFDLQITGNCVGNWDPDRLAQICSNLLGNAIEHGDASAPVRVLLDGSAEDSVELLVSNTGKPIVPEALPHLFLAFRRAPGSGRGRGGVGLGLYIVEQIVRSHGGTIEAHSDENSTRFTVRLPRTQP